MITRLASGIPKYISRYTDTLDGMSSVCYTQRRRAMYIVHYTAYIVQCAQYTV